MSHGSTSSTRPLPAGCFRRQGDGTALTTPAPRLNRYSPPAMGTCSSPLAKQTHSGSGDSVAGTRTPLMPTSISHFVSTARARRMFSKTVSTPEAIRRTAPGTCFGWRSSADESSTLETESFSARAPRPRRIPFSLTSPSEASAPRFAVRCWASPHRRRQAAGSSRLPARQHCDRDLHDRKSRRSSRRVARKARSRFRPHTTRPASGSPTRPIAPEGATASGTSVIRTGAI